MPESHTLFIVVSNLFREAYLKGRRGENIPVAGSTIVGLEEPSQGKPWSNSFQSSVHEKIAAFRSRPGLRVRLAGHFRTCFGAEAARGERDRPMPDKAEALKAAAGGDLDIQVWGFHHEEGWSRIWASLITVGKALDPAATDEQKREFEARLLSAFEQSGEEDVAAVRADRQWEEHEHLSVIAHDIMSQFTPLRLKLDTADERAAAAAASNDPEYRARAGKKAERLRAEVEGLLPEKMRRARALLDEAADLSPGGRENECWKRAAAMLGGEAPAADREAFWRWAGELHDILKNLVR
ncbi:MAG TPA: hypothetical protein VG148_13590 [Pyrinomonadaceae bacterium]|nr:hypothetical protein [Pyrinomonadaceae bacterium]